MKPHHFNEDADGTCELCGKSADHPIHELDAVPIGDAEDDPREDERRDNELTGDVRDFEPPDEDEPEYLGEFPPTVTGLFESYGRDLP